jgi:hypothetical protein
MPKLNLLTLAFALTSTAVADFSGKGNIFVLKSDDSRTASLDKKAGCLNSAGKFVSNGAVCGVFTKNADPYNPIISSTDGPCTWADQSQEKNTDSIYGKGDNAFHCAKGLAYDTNDGLYTIVSLSCSTSTQFRIRSIVAWKRALTVSVGWYYSRR